MIQQLIHLYYHLTYKGAVDYNIYYYKIIDFATIELLKNIGFYPHRRHTDTWPKLIEFILEHREFQ